MKKSEIKFSLSLLKMNRKYHKSGMINSNIVEKNRKNLSKSTINMLEKKFKNHSSYYNDLSLAINALEKQLKSK
jgi:hypothetical protein